MKKFLICCALTLNCIASHSHAAPATNTSLQHARQLHFGRGATSLQVRGFLSGSQHLFYTLQTRAGQKLRISVAPASKGQLQLVPLLFVTPPRGHFDGEKTEFYSTNSTRAGDYRIEVVPNLMASNARSGPFMLQIRVR